MWCFILSTIFNEILLSTLLHLCDYYYYFFLPCTNYEFIEQLYYEYILRNIWIENKAFPRITVDQREQNKGLIIAIQYPAGNLSTLLACIISSSQWASGICALCPNFFVCIDLNSLLCSYVTINRCIGTWGIQKYLVVDITIFVI